MQRHGLPFAGAGQRVGLLGGSFDPAHGGHVHVTRVALARFGLAHVWWLVSPGNPLKEHGPAPLAARVAAARALMRHPGVTVTDIEARLGTRATADTLAALGRLYPRLRFVWLMGADNLAEFHRWARWREIMENVPVGVVARPGLGVRARLAPAARAYAGFRLRGPSSRLLAGHAAPAWCFVDARLRHESSTVLREGGHWPAG